MFWEKHPERCTRKSVTKRSREQMRQVNKAASYMQQWRHGIVWQWRHGIVWSAWAQCRCAACLAWCIVLLWSWQNLHLVEFLHKLKNNECHPMLTWQQQPRVFNTCLLTDTYRKLWSAGLLTHNALLGGLKLQKTDFVHMFLLSYCCSSKMSLHCAWVVDDAKCIVVTSVCLCVCLRPYAHTTAQTRM